MIAWVYMVADFGFLISGFSVAMRVFFYSYKAYILSYASDKNLNSPVALSLLGLMNYGVIPSDRICLSVFFSIFRRFLVRKLEIHDIISPVVL